MGKRRRIKGQTGGAREIGCIVFCETRNAGYSIRMVGAPGAMGCLAYLHLVNDLRGKEGLRCIFSVCKA